MNTQTDASTQQQQQQQQQREKEKGPKLNSHHATQQEPEEERENGLEENGHLESHSCLPVNAQQSLDPSTFAASPCSSPLLAKRMGQETASSSASCNNCSSTATNAASSTSPGGANSASLQSSYQAGIHQRFHAARHKFQGHADPEPQPQTGSPNSRAGGGGSPSSPRALSPTSTPSPEASPARQMARSTVTQVLSRFTVQQQQQQQPCATAAPNSSPFGTDYRNLAPNSPSLSASSRVPSGALSPGIRSPTIPRADRGNPPPIPPKKPGLAQAPPSPALVPRANHNHFTEQLSPASCGLTSSQEGVKELDMVVSSSG